MALIFPSSPSNGQVYTDTVTGNRYLFNSTANVWSYAANNVGMSVSSTPPSNVAAGAMWFNREIGRTFVYYDDGDSKQWIETVPAGAVDTNVVAGYVNPVFASMNGAYTTANAGFGKANNALANTTGTFAGTLNVTGNLGVGLSPTYKIDMTGGDFRINSSYGLRLEGTSSDQYTQYVSGGTLFWNNGSERMRVDSTGNVSINHTGSWGKLLIGVDGIGMASPKMNANGVNDVMVVSAPYGSNNTASVSNAGAKWGIRLMGAADAQYTNGNKSACIYAVSEDSYAGYNRQVGMAFHTSGFDSSNLERMRIDGNGRVTMPYQPVVYATKDNNPTWVNYNTPATYVFNNALVNNGNYYNASSGVFTCPVAGYYKVSAGLLIGNVTYGFVHVYKNNSQYGGQGHFVPSNGTQYATTSYEWIVYCSVNDTIKIVAISGNGTAIYDGGGYSFLTIELLA